MFKVMYHNYSPYVEIAAEKYGSHQINMIAGEFAKIILNWTHFINLSDEEM